MTADKTLPEQKNEIPSEKPKVSNPEQSTPKAE